MNILGTDPLGILNAMSQAGRRGWNAYDQLTSRIPGDAYVDQQLGELAQIAFGQPQMRDPRTGALVPIQMGMVEMGPWGRLGAGMRMGPARTLAERERVVEQRRAFRKGERFVSSLPEMDPKQNAFRQYILSRVQVPKPVRQPAHSEQELGLLEDMEELLPERSMIANEMMQHMTRNRFGQALEETLEQANRSRAGMASYDSVDRAKINISELIAEDSSEALQVSQKLLNAGDTEAALEAVRDAARLAALNWRYNRTPKQFFEMTQDRYYSGQRALSNKQVDRESFPGEGKSWAELKDNALKNSFRGMMRTYRDLRRRPDRMH